MFCNAFYFTLSVEKYGFGYNRNVIADLNDFEEYAIIWQQQIGNSEFQ